MIVDDGSSDETPSILDAWATRLPLRVLRHTTRQGIACSVAEGVSATRASLIFRLDADDEWLPSHVAVLGDAAARMPDAVLFTGRAEFVDSKPVGISKVIDDRSVRRDLMWDNPFVHSAVAFRRLAYQDSGGYTSGVLWEDYRLWIKLAARGGVYGSPEVTIRYFIGHNSLSRHRRAVALRDRCRCQLFAVRHFAFRHPWAAIGSALTACARITLGQ